MTQRRRVAVITGAGQGIGLEIAKQLIAQGASVVLNDIDPTMAEHAARELSGLGGECWHVVGDVSDTTVVQRLVNEAVSRFGRLDIAVANAGVTLFGSFWDYEPGPFTRVLGTNLGGSFFLAQAAARQMRNQGDGGRILLMSSVTGHQAHKDLAAYGMTKAALEMLAKSLVIELSQFKITVNAIAPGATLTERTASDAAYESTWSKLTPLGRPAMVSDIAHAALFLLSEQSQHITGQTLIVDGGWTCTSPSP